MTEISDLRREFVYGGLSEEDVVADPLEQVRRWYEEALRAEVPDANAMVLATADAGGAPSARVVLLKEIDATGFVFYTNRASRKGEELAANPRAALCFYWGPLDRQVRVEGRTEPTAPAEADLYFARRPPGSRIAAALSQQSRPIASRQELEERFAELERRYPAGDVPRPTTWGGYRLVPDSVELWQGRLNRLHDRLRYRRHDGGWVLERLQP
ncbi:MAG TPA: pyridoxamine 5'-phosphate oxidase [Thermoanaerobaculia bacterium]|nr:pyridoxamine 5'-phosphate oxidase [Thermoanaerobaculia bacterium]